MAELFRLAAQLDPHGRTSFVEDVVSELDGQAEIDLGLVHRVVLADAGHDGIATTECDLGPVLRGFGYRMEPVECWCDGEPALSGPTVLAWLRRRRLVYTPRPSCS
jgi:hypothetical protein